MDNEDFNEQEAFDQSVEEEISGQAAVPLCPNCLTPCSPHDYYCPNCGSNEAINPLASYMPFVRIRYEVGVFGRIWNRCRNRKISWLERFLYLFSLLLLLPLLLKIAYIPFCLFYLPVLLFTGVLCVLYKKLKQRTYRHS